MLLGEQQLNLSLLQPEDLHDLPVQDHHLHELPNFVHGGLGLVQPEEEKDHEPQELGRAQD